MKNKSFGWLIQVSKEAMKLRLPTPTLVLNWTEYKELKRDLIKASTFDWLPWDVRKREWELMWDRYWNNRGRIVKLMGCPVIVKKGRR